MMLLLQTQLLVLVLLMLLLLELLPLSLLLLLLVLQLLLLRLPLLLLLLLDVDGLVLDEGGLGGEGLGASAGLDGRLDELLEKHRAVVHVPVHTVHMKGCT